MNSDETFEEEPEIVNMLQERIERYETGEGKSYTWEEAKPCISPSALEDINSICEWYNNQTEGFRV